MPELVRARKGRYQRLRFWSAACCTGEEAYSLAILLHEAISDLADWQVTIIATEFNPDFLATAAAASYGPWSFRDVPPEMRARYFRQTAGKRYTLLPEMNGVPVEELRCSSQSGVLCTSRVSHGHRADLLPMGSPPDSGRVSAGSWRLSSRSIIWTIPPLPRVRGDVSMLRQALVNLLSNAVKYTRPRNPSRIEIGCAADEAGRVVLFVRDNGVGFDMDYAGKLFGVFQRLHRADESQGTGIGPANVRQIVVRHGGRVWAQASPDQGATFYLTLAAASEEEPPARTVFKPEQKN